MKTLNYNNLRTQVLVAFLLTLSLIFLLLTEKSDINTTIFAFILYCPYVLYFVIYNALCIKILEFFTKRNVINYIIPAIPILIYFLANNYSITIRFWKFNPTEVLVGLTILLSGNIVGYFSFKKNV